MIQQFPVTWILLTSSFIAETAINIFGDHLLEWRIASISPITSSNSLNSGTQRRLKPPEATMKSLLDSIESWQNEHAEDEGCKEIPAGKTVPTE